MKVLKILDNSLPDVEQVIEVPKIILHQVPQRAVPREPQLEEQLVDVPVPSVREVTIMAPFVDTAGRMWYWLSGPDGEYTWWLAGTSHHQGTHPEGITASPRRYINTGQG